MGEEGRRERRGEREKGKGKGEEGTHIDSPSGVNVTRIFSGQRPSKYSFAPAANVAMTVRS
jgi:hypothetical protein